MLMIAVQALLFYLMLLIGLSLTFTDLLRIKRSPYLIMGVSLAQLLILPALAYLLILLFQPSETVAMGMLLVSVCPGGALSNFYALVAKADVSLSLSLTAVSSLISVFLLPIILLFFYPQFISDTTAVEGIASSQAIQLGLMLLLPVLIGLLLRWKLDEKVIAILPLLERIGFLGLLGLITAILLNILAT